MLFRSCPHFNRRSIVKSAEKAQSLAKKKEEAAEEAAGPTELEVLQEIKTLLAEKK